MEFLGLALWIWIVIGVVLLIGLILVAKFVFPVLWWLVRFIVVLLIVILIFLLIVDGLSFIVDWDWVWTIVDWVEGIQLFK